MSKSFWKVYFLRIYFLDFKGCQKSTRKVSSLKLYRQISVDVKSTSLKSALSRNPDYHHYNELNKRSLFTGWLHLCGRQIHLCGWQIPLSWNCVVAGGYRWRQIKFFEGWAFFKHIPQITIFSVKSSSMKDLFSPNMDYKMLSKIQIPTALLFSPLLFLRYISRRPQITSKDLLFGKQKFVTSSCN